MHIVLAAALALTLGAGVFRPARRFYSPSRIAGLTAAAVLGWAILVRASAMSVVPRMLVTNAVLLAWVVMLADAVRARSTD